MVEKQTNKLTVSAYWEQEGNPMAAIRNGSSHSLQNGSFDFLRAVDAVIEFN
jgi:hypothetical protein